MKKTYLPLLLAGCISIPITFGIVIATGTDSLWAVPFLAFGFTLLALVIIDNPLGDDR
jgi:hypothetical protein